MKFNNSFYPHATTYYSQSPGLKICPIYFKKLLHNGERNQPFPLYNFCTTLITNLSITTTFLYCQVFQTLLKI